MESMHKTKGSGKSDGPGLLSALAFLAVVAGICAVVIYAFASASYLGPVLAAVAGVVVIVLGAVFGDSGRGEPGNNAASVAVMLVGMFLIVIGVDVALVHFLRSHF